ncbi:MAG: peroxiredoxin family protein [Actinobacteria bacterium]|nr:peroxiredoxin family protein [Actinomycetota bacterium]
MGRRWIAAVLGTALLGVSLAGCSGGTEIAVGNPAPGFALPAAGGGTVSLADYGDGPVLLFFHMADG